MVGVLQVKRMDWDTSMKWIHRFLGRPDADEMAVAWHDYPHSIQESVEKLVDEMSQYEIIDLERQVKNCAHELLKLSDYLLMRGAAGCGDSGHRKAFDRMMRRANTKKRRTI